jgi:hypothetical protein
LDDQRFGVVAVLGGVVGDEVVSARGISYFDALIFSASNGILDGWRGKDSRKFMRHDHRPVDHGIGPRPLLRLEQMQAFKVAVVEEEAFVLIEGDGGASVIVKDVDGASIQAEAVGGVLDYSCEKLQGGAVGGEELVGGGGELAGEKDADAEDFADGFDIVPGFGVAVGGGFFDVVDGWGR